MRACFLGCGSKWSKLTLNHSPLSERSASVKHRVSSGGTRRSAMQRLNWLAGFRVLSKAWLILSGTCREFVRLRHEVITKNDSLRLLEVAFSRAADGVCIATPDMTLVKVNAAMCAMTGRSEADLLGSEYWECVHPEDVDLVRGVISRLLEEGSGTAAFENRLLSVDAAECWQHTELTCLRDESVGEVSYILAHIKNIQARKEADRALRDALERKRIAAEIVGLGEVRLSLRPTSPGSQIDVGSILEQAEFNDEARAILGFDGLAEGADLSNRWRDIIHQDDQGRLIDLIDSLLDSTRIRETTTPLLCRVIRPSGEVRHVKCVSRLVSEDRGRLETILITFLDVTEETRLTERVQIERKKLAAALTRSELAAEVAGIGIYRFKSKTGEEYWDKRLCQIFGRDSGVGGAAPRAWVEQVHPRDRGRVLKDVRIARHSGASIQFECRIVRPDGEVRYVKVSANTKRNAIGEADEIVAAVWDVTSQVMLQKDVERRRAFLDTTLGAIADAVVRTDRAGIVRYANEAAIELSGLSEGNVLGQKLTACFRLSGGQANEVNSLVDGMRSSGLPLRAFVEVGEGRLKAVDVSLRTFGNGPDGQVAVFHDITALQDSKAELTKAQMLFRNALDHAPMGLAVIDFDGKVSFVNDALGKIFGYSPSDLIGSDASEILWPIGVLHGDVDPGYPEEGERRFERILKHAAGHDVRVRISVKEVRGEQGGVLYSVANVEDISEEFARTEELHAAKELAQVTIASASEGIVRTDENGVVTVCNPVAAELVGAVPGKLIGEEFSEVFSFVAGRNEDPVPDPVKEVILRGGSVRMGHALKLRGDGDLMHHVNLSIAPTCGTDGSLTGAVVLIQNASEVSALTERLARQALSDDLTGCGNRRAFEQALKDCVESKASTDTKNYLLFMDLDRFKIINDVCGHRSGDKVLCDMARIFRERIGANDFLARIGGDEFAIILREETQDGAVEVARDIIAEAGRYRLTHKDGSFQSGVSIGIVEVPGGADTATVLAEVDVACYTAKNQGRGRYCVFESSDASLIRSHESQNWYHRILSALDDDRVMLFVQKIVTKDGEAVGYEALMRLREAAAIYGPGAFLGHARRHNLMPKLDRVMFKSVLAEMNGGGLSVTPKEGHFPYVSVNLSAASVADAEFRTWLEELVAENTHLTERLWVELTETDLIYWSDEERSFVERLRKRGVKVFLDDFGTGYNSFDILKRISVDGLKLDHSVIKDVMASPIDQALVGASLGIARNLDLDLVAEGVDRSEVVDFLSSLGVKKFQGYYFHQPEEVGGTFRDHKCWGKRSGTG